MINYKFYIDKHDGKGLVELKNKPYQGHSDVKVLGEELDSGFMILLLKNKTPLPPMTYIKYEISDGLYSMTREFCVSNDEPLRKGKSEKYYQHNIELIELTKMLEKRYLGTLCFTQPVERGQTRYYLSDCINRILRVFETVEDNENVSIYTTTDNERANVLLDLKYKLINSDLYEKLEKIPAPNLVFNNPTLREALDGVLKYVNAVVRLEKSGEYKSFNKELLKFTNTTKITIRIENNKTKVNLKIKPILSVSDIIIDWGNDKYQIIDEVLDGDTVYNFTNIYDKGTYEILLPDNNKYEIVGEYDGSYKCCLTNYDTNENIIIEKVHIGNIESLGEYAFANCTELSQITFDDCIKYIKQYCFYNCKKIYTLNLPISIRRIDIYAFGATDIKEMIVNSYEPFSIFPNSFDKIKKIFLYHNTYDKFCEDDVWKDYRDLFVKNYDGYTTIDYKKISNSGQYPYIRIVPTKTTDNFEVYWGVGDTQVYSVKKNEPIVLYPSEENRSNNIGTYTIEFYNNDGFYFEGLEKKYYPEEDYYEYASAFWSYWDELEEVEEGYSNFEQLQLLYADLIGCTTIGKYAFYNEIYLNEVYITRANETISEKAFEGCESLKQLHFEYGPTEIGKYAFAFSGLENIEIPSSVVNIRESAFEQTKIKEIIFNNGILNIERHSFITDDTLSLVYIPRGVNTIGEQAFTKRLQRLHIYIDYDRVPYTWNENWTDTFNIHTFSYENSKDNYTINADFYGKKKNKISKNKYFSETSLQNIEQYSTNIISFTKNITSEEKYNNFNVIQYPKTYLYDIETNQIDRESLHQLIFWNDKQGFARLKSPDNNYNIDDSNYGILTQNKIQSVINVQIPVSLDYDSTYIQFVEDDLENQKLGRKAKIILDITESIIEEEEYENLTNEEKNNYFYYKKADNFISFGGSFKEIIFETHSIENVIAKALEKFANKYSLGEPDSSPTSDTATIELTEEESTDIISRFKIKWGYENGKYYIKESSILAINNITKTSYRISYVPLVSVLLSSEKQNTNNAFLNSDVLINQEDRLLSFSNFSNTLHSITQRNGNVNKELSCLHYTLYDLINVGDYTEDNYVVTKAEYIYYNNYICGKYSLDKDYNRISSYMGINSDIRQYEVPNTKDTYERNIINKSYCEVSFKDNYDKCETMGSTLSFYIRKTLGLADVYNYGKFENNPVKFAIIKYNMNYTENMMLDIYYDKIGVNSSILLECFTTGGPNVLNFNFGFNNNLSAGSVIKEDEIFFDTTYKLLKQQIPYCYPYTDEDKFFAGCLRNLSYELTDGKEIVFANEDLPMIPVQKTSKGIIRTNDILLLKDPSEILKFTHQLHFIMNDERVTLGNAFFENNYIHHNIIDYTEDSNYKQLGEPINYFQYADYNRKFKVYTSSETYDKLDINVLKNKNKLKEVTTYTNGTIQTNKLFDIKLSTKNITDFSIQIRKEILDIYLADDTKTIILADEYDNIIMHIAYDKYDLDENGENYIFKPIYFNFKDKRSDIKYDY